MTPKKPVVWIIDSNHWERADIRAVLIERGCEVEGFVSVFHAVAMLYRAVVEKPAAIVLEASNIPCLRRELDELVSIGTPIILLTGVYSKLESGNKQEWAAVLRRPFTIGQVVETVESLLG